MSYLAEFTQSTSKSRLVTSLPCCVKNCSSASIDFSSTLTPFNTTCEQEMEGRREREERMAAERKEGKKQLRVRL